MRFLQTSQQPDQLATNLFSPVFSASNGESIHLFGAGDHPITARHLVLNQDGQPTGNNTLLSNTLVEGIAFHSGQYVLLNGQVASDHYKAQAYDLNGAHKWDCLVPVSRSHARFTQLTVIDGNPVAVWATIGGNTTRNPGKVREVPSLAALYISKLAENNAEPPRFFPLKGSLTALCLAPTSTGLLAACDPRGRLELMHLNDREVLWQIQLEQVYTPSSFSVAISEYQICLAWINHDQLFVQWFDLSGRATSEPRLIASAPEGARLLSTNLFGNNRDHLAITYIKETTTDDWNMLEGEFGRQHRFLPKLAYQEFVTFLQPGHGAGPWQLVTPPGLPYHTACWLRDTFYLIHGEQIPLISRFQLV